MKYLAVPFKQLIERRLWPVAVLLVAALVGIPKLLADPEPAAEATTTTNAITSADPTRTVPIVSTADPAKTDRRRRVLGARKDPFRPAIKASKQPAASSASSPSGATAAASTGASAGSTRAGGGSERTTTTAPSTTYGGSGTSSTTTPTTTTAPAATYKVYTPYVRYSTSAGAGDVATGLLRRLGRLPMADPTALQFLGLKADRKTAVFLVDPSATVHGDGVCEPRPDNCQRITLKAGDRETATISGAVTYTIDLVRIQVDTTSSAAAAAEARADEAPGGRAYMRRHLDRVGGYRYSVHDGVLRPSKTTQTTRKVAAAAVATATPATAGGTTASAVPTR